ncbi:MAG: ATP-dependent helicase [Paludibacteraceae bacterium]|nr:ATP-dependent helicase [Paludibacteraceae bacterium]
MTEKLNEQQQQAVEYKGKHLLVIAGAGTGKTRTIIARAKHLIQQGVPASRILILSFTRKSAREIVERIKSEIGGLSIEGLRGQTFHSWCMDIIMNNPKVFMHHEYTLLDEDDRESCIKLLCGKGLKDKENHAIKPTNVLDVYSYAINARCNLSDAMRMKLYDNASSNDDKVNKSIELNKPIYTEIIKRYLAYKTVHKYMDYDDILNVVAKGLLKNETARKYIANRYDHILVDEMQDTNPLQYELLSSFYETSHLFCVGDDAQSIYAFRGADFKTMHRFTEVVPNSERMDLTINYRSTQEILDLSNWILNQSKLDYKKELSAAKGHGKKPVFITCESEWDEANDVTDKILQSLNVKGYKYEDNMVLSRSLYGLRTVESQCISKHIPYIIFGGTSLMQSKHVRDVVSPMRIVANYKDELAWMRYLLLWKGIGEVTASRIINNVIEEETLDQCLDKLSGQGLQEEITQTLKNISQMQFDPAQAITRTLESMEKRLKELYKEEWNWRKQDFDILKEVAIGTGGIQEFVSEYVLDPKLETTVKQAENGNSDACILTTIHSAKGLEVSICYLLKASPASYPTPRAVENGEDAIEEERRCLYVALTRAKDELYIYRNVHSIHVDENSDDPCETLYFFNHTPESLTDKEETFTFRKSGKNAEYNGEVIGTDIIGDFDFE